MRHPLFARRLVPLVIAVGLTLVPACGGSGNSTPRVRLGYFANVTHAPALVGVIEGFFAEELGDDATLRLTTFNAGPDAITALFAESLDMSFIGPNPAINGFSQSDGAAIRIVAGTVSQMAETEVLPNVRQAVFIRVGEPGVQLALRNDPFRRRRAAPP